MAIVSAREADGSLLLSDWNGIVSLAPGLATEQWRVGELSKQRRILIDVDVDFVYAANDWGDVHKLDRTTGAAVDSWRLSEKKVKLLCMRTPWIIYVHKGEAFAYDFISRTTTAIYIDPDGASGRTTYHQGAFVSADTVAISLGRAGGGDGVVVVDLGSAELLLDHRIHRPQHFVPIASSGDGQFVWVGGDGLRRFDLETRKVDLSRLLVKSTCIAASRDGRVVAIGTPTGDVVLHDAETFEKISEFELPEERVPRFLHFCEKGLLISHSRNRKSWPWGVWKSQMWHYDSK